MAFEQNFEPDSLSPAAIEGTLVPYLAGPVSAAQLPLLPSRTNNNPPRKASVEAWERHLQNLKHYEREMFQECQQGDLESYIDSIDNTFHDQQAKSWTSKIAKLIEPLFKTMRRYMPLARIAVQAKPMPSSLVLAGIVCIMQISSEYHSYQEKLAAILSRMGLTAHILTQLSDRLHQYDDEVQEALVEVYGDILQFCSKALKLFVDENGKKRNRARMLGNSLLLAFDESSFGQIATNFEKHLEDFKFIAEANYKHNLNQHVLYLQHQGHVSHATMLQLHEEQAEQSRERERAAQQAKRMLFLKWLPSTSFEKIRDDKYESRVGGTGQWLFNSKEYRSWKSGSKSTALWIKGKNGCGKSVVASVALAEIRENAQPGTGVAHFFCSSLQDETREPSKLLGSMLRQLCEKQTNIDRIAERIFDQSESVHPTGPNWGQITAMINSVVSNFTTTFLVCDGLDECQDQRKVAEFLLSLSRIQTTTVKVLLLSRPDYENLEEVLEDCPVLQMDNGANDVDMKKFIAETLSKGRMPIKDESQLLETQQVVFSKAEGMFLYISLLTKNLLGSRTLNQLQTRLESLPVGLDKVYEFSMKRIFDEPDAETRKWALEMLFWTTNAKRRLTRSEMLEAMVIKPGAKGIDDGDRITLEIGLTALCGDLVCLDSDGYYNLVHSSLKDYLLKVTSSTFSPLDEYQLRQKNADYVMGEICLTYLLFSKFENYQISSTEDLKELLKENSFFKYAAEFFGSQLSAEAAEKLHSLILKLLDCAPLRDLILQAVHAKAFPRAGEASQLILLSYCNLSEIAKSLPGLESQSSRPGPFGLYPLDYAFWQRSKEMCLWLLESCSTNTARPAAPTSAMSVSHLAAENDWADVIDKLSTLGENMEARNKAGETPLSTAAGRGSINVVERLLREPNVNVDSVDGKGNTPLMLACNSNRIDSVRRLLQSGADTKLHRQDGWTALHLAVANNNVEIANVLLEHGADIEAQAKGYNDWTPISIAAGLNCTEAVRMLLHKGAGIEVVGENGSTPLHAAVWNGAYHSTKLLIEFQAVVEKEDNAGTLPFLKAAHAGHLTILKLLLDQNPMLIDRTDGNQETALHHAAFSGHREVVTFLLESGAKIDMLSQNGETALHLATSGGHMAVAELLLQAGSDPKIQNNSEESVLHLCARHESSGFIKQLLQVVPGLNVNVTDKWKRTPLHIAAVHGKLDTVKCLLELKAEITRDVDNESPLHSATESGHKDVVHQFLSKGHTDAGGYKGRTALYIAAGSGNMDLVQVLLDAGADVNLSNDWGYTPLTEALISEKMDVVCLLLKQEVDVNHSTYENFSPLHAAAQFASVDIIKTILDLGGMTLTQTITGETPLSLAISGSRIEAAELLLEADPEAVKISNIRGIYPIHVAAHTGNLQILNKLIELGADPKVCCNRGLNSLCYTAANGNVDLAERLICLGVEVNDPGQEYAMPPLALAAFSGQVDLICYMISMMADVNYPESLTESTPLMCAAAYHRPLVVEILLKAGGDPFRRDAFGLSAIDYAAGHPASLEKFASFMESYRPIDEETRLTIVRRSIIRYLERLIRLCKEVTTAAQEERLKMTRALAEAFTHLSGSDAIDFARFCSNASSSRLKGNMIYESRDCELCRKSTDQEDKYRCIKCCGVYLCSGCHSSYLKGWKTPRTAPEGFRIFEALEKEIRKMMLLLRPYAPSGWPCILEFLSLLPSVGKWFSTRIKAYEEWESSFNGEKLYNHRPRPGQEFLKLFAESRTTVENSTNEQVEADEAVVALNKKLEDLFRRYRPDEDFQDFVCANHEYIRISHEELKQLQANGDILDENGQLAEHWLRKLLTRFQGDVSDCLTNDSNIDRTNSNTDVSVTGGGQPLETAGDGEIGSSTRPASSNARSSQPAIEPPIPSSVQSTASSSMSTRWKPEEPDVIKSMLQLVQLALPEVGVKLLEEFFSFLADIGADQLLQQLLQELRSDWVEAAGDEASGEIRLLSAEEGELELPTNEDGSRIEDLTEETDGTEDVGADHTTDTYSTAAERNVEDGERSS